MCNRKQLLAVSYSGNGPAIAAVVHKDNIENLKNSFANLKGRMIVSQVNNNKAFVIIVINNN